MSPVPMRYDRDTRTFRASATDLANHARCPHLTQLTRAREVAIADGSQVRAEIGDALVLAKGREHEAQVVAARRAAVEAGSGRFADIVDRDPRDRRDALERAMRDGVELIAQAPLRAGALFGYADLLIRVDDASEAAGTLRTCHRYEPVEIKYARSVRPEHLLQASAYADALELLQGAMPAHLHVVTGDGQHHVHRTAEYVEYFRAARERLAADLSIDVDDAVARMPEPVPHCIGCEFRGDCQQRWVEADHLSLVAGIRADQRAKLTAVGVTTVAQLAELGDERVPGIGRSTLPRLATQARLQRASRGLDPADTHVAYRAPEPGEAPGRGFALLPEPHDDDMFFDFEGYPYHERGALEYLWGWTTRDAGGRLAFDHLWADDPTGEGVAFAAFLDEVHARRERSGKRMHVFHYAPYEITALRRLAKEHPHEMHRLDELLRAGVFVDLFAVVRQAMQVGTASYSIKSLEPLYGVSRVGDELADGGASIEVYERWLSEGDDRVRATIIDYNRVDCDSTLALRDWLLHHRDAAERDFGIAWPPEPVASDDPEAPSDEGSGDLDPGPSLVEQLEAVALDEARSGDVRLAARLLGAMPGWQRRSRREFFGDLYARQRERDADDFLDEPTAISGLELVDAEPTGRGSTLRRYRFPEQVTLVKAGQVALDAETIDTAGSIEAVDLDERIVSVKTTPAQQARLDERAVRSGRGEARLPVAIVGWTSISLTPLEQAARRVGEQLLAALAAQRDPFAPLEPGAAALSILARRPTHALDGPGTEALADPPDPTELAALARRVPGSHLIVQGPPGTGKTHTSARVVAALVEAGLRVGISSNSHDAVVNVLRGLDRLSAERATAGDPLQLRVAYPLRTGERAPGALDFGGEWIARGTSDGARGALTTGDVQVIAGTAWLFARDVQVDVLLVDEAGQVSLLHGTAMAAAARSVVLVGDPQQLPQPADVQHPHGCGASVLEHLFQDEAVLPRERAALLSVTRRMHPAVTSFISDAYYRGTLHAHPSTSAQHVRAAGLPRAGTVLLPVPHAGNRVRSDEEVAAITALVARLLESGRVVPHPDTPEREVRPEDIIVVAPYNAQRIALQDALGPDVRVGTVDKFQGQEAPVSILSMTASSRHELPRGLEFLLDPHRLNVGVSRARALAVVVASPTLLATPATSLLEMRLLNDLQRLARHRSQLASSCSSSSSRRS